MATSLGKVRNINLSQVSGGKDRGVCFVMTSQKTTEEREVTTSQFFNEHVLTVSDAETLVRELTKFINNNK